MTENSTGGGYSWIYRGGGWYVIRYHNAGHVEDIHLARGKARQEYLYSCYTRGQYSHSGGAIRSTSQMPRG